MKTAVGVDLGGTKIAAGVIGSDGTLKSRAEVPTETSDPAGVCARIAELVRGLQPDGVEGVGIGAAGIVDHETGYYLYGPNTGLRELNLRDVVSQEIAMPVRVDNDANCAAWAEHRFGVGRGTRQFLCVTLGTGIGGGIVADGKPYRGAHGGAAEIGHMLVDPNGPPCGCGRHGCWEQFASGMALERNAREHVREHPDSALARESDIDGRAVTEAARAGDAFAQSLVAEMARWIGWGLGSLVNILEPERIAMAGGVVRDWDLFETAAIEAMREQTEAAERRSLPEVRPASLGVDAGVVGAASLFFES